jgi:hypothetical protein
MERLSKSDAAKRQRLVDDLAAILAKLAVGPAQANVQGVSENPSG